MNKIRPPQFSVCFPNIPSLEEMRSLLPHIQDSANQFLRSVSDYWQCRLLDSGVLELFQTFDGHEQIDFRYDANNNTLYLGASASCVLDLGRHIDGISDHEATKLVMSLARMYGGFTPLQSWIANALTLEPARLVAVNRRRAA